MIEIYMKATAVINKSERVYRSKNLRHIGGSILIKRYLKSNITEKLSTYKIASYGSK